MTRELKVEPPRMFDEYGQLRLIPLDEAARLVRFDPQDLIAFALATADWGAHRLNMIQAPGGPWFDAAECEGLNIVMGWVEEDEAKAASRESTESVNNNH